MFLQTHYRSPIEFTDDILAQAKSSLMRLHDFMTRFKNYEPELKNGKQQDFEDYILNIQKRFEDAMNDDFQTPQALAAVFDFVKEVNRRIDTDALNRDSKESAMTFMMKIDNVLGVLVSTQNEDIDGEVMLLIEEREKARKEKNWKRSDELRDQLLV